MNSAAATGRRLDAASLARGTSWLARRDPDLRHIVRRHGPPPLWGRPGGFRTLVQIVLEQQVSLASGKAALRRIESRHGRITPERIRSAGEAGIRAAGITRQKSGFLVGLAEAAGDGRLNFRRLVGQPDDEAREALIALRGVGRWTADVYLLMALRRPDIWPPGDLALQKALQWAKGLPDRPQGEAELALAEPWRPWRAVAARILWHGYLSERDRGSG